MSTDNIDAINVRYSELAETSCCLSCGGALNHSKPQLGEICVDLGSGRGNDVLRMAELVGREGFVYGIDISDGMIDKAKKNATKFGVENVKFITSKLEKLPLDDRSVDLVISNCTINHADDKQSVWNDVFRILKEGGRFVVSDIYSTKEVPEKYRTDPEAIAECWAGSVEKSVYLNQLKVAGFNEIRVIESSDPYPKGEIEVVSWTIMGVSPKSCACNK